MIVKIVKVFIRLLGIIVTGLCVFLNYVTIGFIGSISKKQNGVDFNREEAVESIVNGDYSSQRV